MTLSHLPGRRRPSRPCEHVEPAPEEIGRAADRARGPGRAGGGGPANVHGEEVPDEGAGLRDDLRRRGGPAGGGAGVGAALPTSRWEKQVCNKKIKLCFTLKLGILGGGKDVSSQNLGKAVPLLPSQKNL